MSYQWTDPWVVDDSKFRTTFPEFQTSDLDQAIRDTVAYVLSRSGAATPPDAVSAVLEPSKPEPPPLVVTHTRETCEHEDDIGAGAVGHHPDGKRRTVVTTARCDVEVDPALHRVDIGSELDLPAHPGHECPELAAAELFPHPESRRSKLVRLTGLGKKSLAVAIETFAELETSLGERIGPETLAGLRAGLEAEWDPSPG